MSGRIPRVVRRPSPPIRDSEHTTAPPPPPVHKLEALELLEVWAAPRPTGHLVLAHKLDTLELFEVWREAVDAGHRTQAAAALAGLTELAKRPAGKADTRDDGTGDNPSI